MKFRVSGDLLFKLALLVLGFADFFGLLPDALDFLDKLLTAGVLAYFWYQLKLSQFLFGKRVKWLDGTILVAFYVLVVDSFLQILRVIDLNSQLALDINFLLVTIPGLSIVKDAFLFLYVPQNAQFISLWSFIIGFTMLIGVALYAALKLQYGKVSVMHSFARIFIKSKEMWEKFSNLTGSSRITKFLLSMLVLFSIYQYFFSLVNQWFVISLDKALLVFAIIYAAKDIKGTKSKALNKLGNFDDLILGGIRDIFTNHKKFYLGFGILLLFHYLSDLATFFLPYFLPSVGIDAFYLDFIGDSSGALHQPLAVLAQDAGVGVGMYVLSALGSLVMILFPIAFLYLIIRGDKLAKISHTYRNRVIISLLFVLSLCFSFYSWVGQKSIRVAGIQGVDFVTNSIGGNVITGTIVAVILFLALLSVTRRSIVFSDHLLVATFLFSFSYFGYYVWNYFASSWFYHTGAMSSLFQSGNIFVSIMFVILFLLEILFYLGGALLFTYESSRLVCKDLVHLSTRSAFVWTFAVIFVPLLIMTQPTASAFTLATTTLAVLLLFSYALFRQFKGVEKRDDYIFGLTVIIMIYQVLVLTKLALEQFIGSEVIIFIQSVFLIGLTLFAARLLNIQFSLGKFRVKKALAVLFFGFLFSILFFVLGEPVPEVSSFVAMFLFTGFIAVSEELLFRGLVFPLARKIFSPARAMHLQAIFFALIHIVGIGVLLDHYASAQLLPVPAGVGLLLYTIGLYVFSLVAGKLSLLRKGVSEPRIVLLYPIIFHWIVNLLTFTIY